jgi:hypothetical protein
MRSSDRPNTVEFLLEHQDLLLHLHSLSEVEKQKLVSIKREKSFKFLWDTLNMEKSEVIMLVIEREDQLIEETSEYGVPDWIMRMEAQDILLDLLREGYEEEGII